MNSASDPPTTTFLGLDDETAEYENAATVILPVPYERTTSYGQGTRNGPAAILAASQQVELYDEELDREPADGGIATVAPCQPESFEPAEALREIEAEARRHMAAGKFVVTLGGEHSLTLAPVRAAVDVFGNDIGVVQFDAHADLRDSYEGTPYSHASVMKRIVDLGLPTLAIGLRSLSPPEREILRRDERPVIWGYELERAEELWDERLAQLPERVYLTLDLDFLDPSLLPATGTPEPGGGFWSPTLRLLRRLFETKDVVAMDVVELAPLPGLPASDFIAAKLAYKCMGYRSVSAFEGPSDSSA